MAFFEDNFEETVKLVDLETGNIYDLVYESNDGSIYESRAKVVSIEEVSDDTCCKPGKGYVREHVGCHNSVYINCECSKDEFMQDPPVKKIRIIVDTSETYNGQYESIMLDTIRDCTLIEEGTNDEVVEDTSDYCNCCTYKTTNCTPDSCGHYIQTEVTNKCNCCTNKNSTYNYDNTSVTISGNKVCITNNEDGITSETDMDSILKYYLGI